MADDGTLRGFAADLGKVASSALGDVDKVVKKGAQNLKEDYAAQASASTHFGDGLPEAITYDSFYLPGRVQYEVGPDKWRRGGALGNIFFFGTPRGGGGTGDIDGPLDREQPRMMRALDDLLGGML